jgi:AmmeMemoRadiSam system protein B
MGIPSSGDRRGQQDAVGFASTAPLMAEVWERSALAPKPDCLGPMPEPGVAGLICPHDDYRYAGRIYRRLIPLVKARTVLLVGVFHKYRRFGAKGTLVFDPYRTWRSPDGDINVSPLREDLLQRLHPGDALVDAAMQDSEHSVEAIAYWLKHQDPQVEILSVLLPAADFARFQDLAAHLGQALGATMKARGWRLGRDLAIIISSDGIHYGEDFKYTPHGLGGVDAYTKATARDREILLGPLAGALSAAKAEAFFRTVVDPQHPDAYRMPWCGRFSIPFGMLLLEQTARALGEPIPVGRPLAFGTSISAPQLRVPGLGLTAEANLFHFVSYPGVAYTLGQ